MPEVRHFTDRLKRVLAATRDHAAAQGAQTIEAQHILAAIAREGEGVAAVVLENLGVRLGDLDSALARRAVRGDARLRKWDLPYGGGAKRAIDRAVREAAGLGHAWVGPEHLLLALAVESGTIAAGVLASFGITADRVRSEILKLV